MRRYALLVVIAVLRRPGWRRGPRERGHRPAPDGHHRHHGHASGGAHRGVGTGRVHRGASRPFHRAGGPQECGHDGVRQWVQRDSWHSRPRRGRRDRSRRRRLAGGAGARVADRAGQPQRAQPAQRHLVELDRGAAMDDATAIAGNHDAAPEAPAYTPSAAMAAMAIPAASVISSVRTTREEGMLSVILEGDGRLSAKNVELAAGNRLYLDFDGVRPAVPAVTPFGQAPVERVRVALNSHEPIVHPRGHRPRPRSGPPGRNRRPRRTRRQSDVQRAHCREADARGGARAGDSRSAKRRRHRRTSRRPCRPERQRRPTLRRRSRARPTRGIQSASTSRVPIFAPCCGPSPKSAA